MVCAKRNRGPRFGGPASDFSPYSSQIDAWKELLLAFSRHRVASDFSDTGVGKTFHALMVASHFRLRPLVITPKVVKPGFEDAMRIFDMGGHVINYEHLLTDENQFVVKLDDGTFRWLVDPTRYMLIYDEGHRICNADTSTGKIALAAYAAGFHMLIATATPFTSPLDMAVIGKLLGLHSGGDDFTKYLIARGCSPKPASMGGGYGFDRNQPGADEILMRINSEAVTGRGTRTRRDQCDGFPNTTIRPLILDLGKQAGVVNAAAKAYAKELGELQTNLRFAEAQHERAEMRGNAMMMRAYKAAARTRLQQIAEMHKVPALAAMVTQRVAKGRQAVVFLNYQESILALGRALGRIRHGFITGQHGDREKTVRLFQLGEIKVVICHPRAGGAGVSLHDLRGDAPRDAFISPNDSMRLVKQALGRVWRRGGKSDSEQFVFFSAGTVEEKVAQNFRALLRAQDLCLDRRVSVEAAAFANGMNRPDEVGEHFDMSIVEDLYFAHEDDASVSEALAEAA